MKVSFYNTGRPVVNGFMDCNTKGTLIFEISAEGDTERSIFRNLDTKLSRLALSVSDEGSVLYLYELERKESV